MAGTVTGARQESPGWAFPEFIQNALSLSLDEIRELLNELPSLLLEKEETFYQALQDSWRPTLVTDLPPVGEGELRPLYTRGVVDSGKLPLSYQADRYNRIVPAEVKNLLLYAHSTILLNPFFSWFGLENGSISSLVPPTGWKFLGALGALVEIAPLLKDSVVHLVDPPALNLPKRDSDYKIDLRKHLSNIGFSIFTDNKTHVSQTAAFEIAQDDFGRLLSAAIIDPEALHSDTMVRQGRIEVQISAVLSQFLSDQNTVDSQDAYRLRTLMGLCLPGASKLRTSDIVDIRADDTLEVFRSELRTALAAADASVMAGEKDAARSEIASYMRAKAFELEKAVPQWRNSFDIKDKGLNFVVALGLGMVDWRLGLLQLLIGLGGSYVFQRPNSATRALHAHYVAIGDESEPQQQLSTDLLEAWAASGKSVQL